MSGPGLGGAEGVGSVLALHPPATVGPSDLGVCGGSLCPRPSGAENLCVQGHTRTLRVTLGVGEQPRPTPPDSAQSRGPPAQAPPPWATLLCRTPWGPHWLLYLEHVLTVDEAES